MWTVRLRERVWFERLAFSEDRRGNVEILWLPFVTVVAAEITPILDEMLTDQPTGGLTYQIRVRGSAATQSVQVGDRAVNDLTGETYDIRAIVKPDYRGNMLVMTCQAGADG
jgi:hypothetical protein